MVRVCLLLVVALAAACTRFSTFDDPVPDADAVSEQAARAPYALYFVGMQWRGMRLTHVEGGREEGFVDYGDCDPGPDAGCAMPIQIQHFPFRSNQWRLAAGCRRRPSLRGVPTARHDGLVLFTGRRVVKVYARTPYEERQIALALRRADGAATPAQLPPPARNVRALVDRVCR